MLILSQLGDDKSSSALEGFPRKALFLMLNLSG